MHERECVSGDESERVVVKKRKKKAWAEDEGNGRYSGSMPLWYRPTIHLASQLCPAAVSTDLVREGAASPPLPCYVRSSRKRRERVKKTAREAPLIPGPPGYRKCSAPACWHCLSLHDRSTPCASAWLRGGWLACGPCGPLPLASGLGSYGECCHTPQGGCS